MQSDSSCEQGTYLGCDLASDIGLGLVEEPQEHRVEHLDQYVIHTVLEQVLNPFVSHFPQDATLVEHCNTHREAVMVRKKETMNA